MLRALLLVLLPLLLGGCANFGYYLQSVDGQMQILDRQRPIRALLADPTTPPALKRKLALVLQVREYASRELGLPNNASYRQYADLRRRYVVWDVFAAPRFSVKLKKWCFLFAGCVDYRGYFNEARAKAYASALRRQGYDVYVSGVSAYSTLGWFDDPVLNTVIDLPDVELAGLIFHELAHQLLYVRDDSEFNESFATAVELEGMRRWLASYGTPHQNAAHAAAQARESQFFALVNGYRRRLAAVYASAMPDEEKAARKAALFADLRNDYDALKASWGGKATYDRWFAHPLNNAQIGALATYTQLLPAFDRLLQDHDGHLRAFYAAVRRVSRLPKATRDARLAAIASRAPAVKVSR